MPEGQAAPAEVEPTRGDDGGGSVVSKKVGPLPLWGWVVVGAAVLGVLWLRGRSASTPAAVGSQAGPQGVLQSDTLTGAQLLGALEDLNAALANQANVAKSTTDVSSLGWRFGSTPSNPASWVWRLTPSGVAAWRAHTGQDPNFDFQPGTTAPPNWLPEYSWQVAEIPAGLTFQDLIRQLTAAVGGRGGVAVNSGTQGAGSGLARVTR